MPIKRHFIYILLFAAFLIAIFLLFPRLFKYIVIWQRDFNQLISKNLHDIQHHTFQAGSLLILISFFYGVFHAAGPGHGKFIIASYLSTHSALLKTGIRLSLLSALMQGIVAIVSISAVIGLLNLSSAYYKTGQLWLERIAFGLLISIGIQWCIQTVKKLRKNKPHLQINNIRPMLNFHQSAVKKTTEFNIYHDFCNDCGHRHLPDPKLLQQAQDWKSQCLIILSIGIRPCSGAVFVLFLSYMLKLYPWGIAAVIAMSLGTGLTLSGFAAMVQYTRQVAIKLGKWYLSVNHTNRFGYWLKLIAGLCLIWLGINSIVMSFQPDAGGAVLLGR